MTTAQAKLTGLGAPGTAPGASLSRLSVRGRALALPITGNRWTDRRATSNLIGQNSKEGRCRCFDLMMVNLFKF
jgi:hypothetical protein